MQTITIINTGCANLSSVKFAFERLGYQAEITDNHTTIQQAEKLVLPVLAQHWRQCKVCKLAN